MEEDVPPETKRCSKGDDCVNEGGADQPLANFNVCGKGRGGLRAECKSCQNARDRARRSTLNNPRSTEPKKCSNKKCPKAGQLQPASCFATSKSASDGLTSNCKACANACTANSKMRSANAFIRNLFNDAKRRAKKRDTPSLTMEVEDWFAIYDAQGGKCALSGIEMTFTYDKDHPTTNAGAKYIKWPYNISPDQIDAGKGYVRGNVQLVCSAVNVMKAELPTEVVLRIVCAMYHHNNIRPRRRRLMLRPRHARVIGS